MKESRGFRDILTSLVKAVGSKIPVTCKIRILPDMTQTLSLVRTIVETGVEALAVHGRTKDERPNHDVHVDAIQVFSFYSSAGSISKSVTQEGCLI